MTDVALIAAQVKANFGRWVADCPRPYCTNAMQVERGQAEYGCGGQDGCGLTAPLVWPADPDAIEALLLMRPAVATRNWVLGETLNELLADNAAYGCIPDSWRALAAAAPSGVVDIFTAEDERVVGGLLFDQLEAAGLRREIGA